MNEEETGERNCSGKVDKTLEFFSGRGRKRNRGREEGGKVIHDKLCVNFLKHRVVFIAMEEKSAQKMLEASKGSFDFPALEINIRDNLGREFICRQISDEEFIVTVAKVDTNEAKRNVMRGDVFILEEVEAFALDKLKIERRILCQFLGTDDGLMERNVKGRIGKIIATGKAIGVNILAAQDKVSANVPEMSDIVEGSIVAVSGNNRRFRVFQAVNEGQKRSLFTVIVEIIDNEVLIDAGNSIVKGFNTELMIRIRAGFSLDHGIIVFKIVRNAQKRTIRSKNTIAIHSLEVGKMRHEIAKKNIEGIRKDLLATHDKSILGRQVRITAQLFSQFAKDRAGSESENSTSHLSEAEIAVT